MRKAALVTGGAVRLGRAISLALAAAEYDLVLHYHSSSSAAEEVAAACREAGAKVELMQADLRDADHVRRMCTEAPRRFERLDALVNNAAIFYPTRTVLEAEVAWEEFVRTNLRAPYLCSLRCATALAKTSGSIVSIADIYGMFPLKGYAPYAITKSGVVSMTRVLALELAPQVRVNAVAPGAILLPANADAESEAKLVKRIPLERMGTPEDIASAVRFLLEAPFVTGQILAVDGGRSIDL